MKWKPAIGLLLLAAISGGRAEELPLAPEIPLSLTLPDGWKSTAGRPPSPAFPFRTFQFVAEGDRNAMVLLSVLDQDRSSAMSDATLRELLRADSRPYVASVQELADLEPGMLSLVSGGTAYYANFTDPDLVGKPSRRGNYKTATPMIVGIGTKFILKVTILCDEFESAEYREALAIVASLEERK